MRTRNETYCSLTNREGISISRNFSSYIRSIAISADSRSVESNLVESWETSKTSIQIRSALKNWARFCVTSVTSRLSSIPAIWYTEKYHDEMNYGSEKVELKEKEMKHVISNISKYAIYAIVSLSVVLGQGTPKLDIHIKDQKVNLTKAEKKDPSQVSYAPGDTIRYVITAANIGNGLMKNPTITDPVPAGVTYVPKSAQGVGTEITFSMNQGKTYMAWPPTYTVRNSKGILVKREATPEMISHVKWDVLKSLNAGEKTTMEFLVVVNK